MSTKKFAFWSNEYVIRGHRTQVWSTPAGDELEACFVLPTETPPNSWPDIKALGEVVAWVRNGQHSLRPPPTGQN